MCRTFIAYILSIPLTLLLMGEMAEMEKERGSSFLQC